MNRLLGQGPPPPLPLVDPVVKEAILQPKPDMVKKLTETERGDSLLDAYMQTLEREVRRNA